jgi:hypothetical protein
MIDDLWSELDLILAEMEPLKVKEREVRAKIKETQDLAYLDAMEPKLKRLKDSGHPGYVNVKNQVDYLNKKYSNVLPS